MPPARGMITNSVGGVAAEDGDRGPVVRVPEPCGVVVGPRDDPDVVGAPHGFLDIHAEPDECAWCAASPRYDHHFRRRRGSGITRIGQISTLIEARIHPLVRPPSESLRQRALEWGAVHAPPNRRAAQHRDPAIVRAEDGRRRDARNLKGLPAGSVHPQEPDRAFLRRRICRGEHASSGGEGEKSAVRTPAWITRAERRIGDTHRRRRTIGSREPDLALPSILRFDQVRAHERDAPSIRRERWATGCFDSIVVLQLEGPRCGRRGAGQPRRGLSEGSSREACEQKRRDAGDGRNRSGAHRCTRGARANVAYACSAPRQDSYSARPPQ